MSRFKVGDKVRCISWAGEFFKVGDIYEILEVTQYGYVTSNNNCRVVGFHLGKFELVESKKEENSDITKDLKKAIGFLDLHDKDKFMLDNIVATLEDRIDEIRRT